MKKTLLAASSLLMMIALAACGGTSTASANASATASSETKVSVVSADDDDDDDDDEESSVATLDYAVTVLYENGDPVTGCSAQLCTDTACQMPVKVDDQGKVTFSIPSEPVYYVHVLGLPTGYTFNPNAYTLTPEARNVTVTAMEIKTAADNKVTSTGVYSVTVDGTDSTDYTLDLADGDYTIESWVDFSAAAGNVTTDPSITFGNGTDDNSGFKNNFRIDVTVKAGQDNVACFKANKATTYNFCISAK